MADASLGAEAHVCLTLQARSVQAESVAAVVHVKVEDVKELLLAQRSPRHERS